jgi:cytochrome bd-type quinol oxidase subunit 2
MTEHSGKMAETAGPTTTARDWSRFRRMTGGTVIVVAIQVVLGFAAGGITVYPATSSSFSSISDFFSALSTAGGPVLLIHAAFGVLVFLTALVTGIRAIRHPKRLVKIASVLGLIFVLVALLGGILWSTSDFANQAGPGLMTIAGPVALVLFIVGYLKAK